MRRRGRLFADRSAAGATNDHARRRAGRRRRPVPPIPWCPATEPPRTVVSRFACRAPRPTRDPSSTSLSFYLFSPERLAEPIMSGPAGAQIMADTEPLHVPWPPALEPDIMRMGHTSICDPTEEFPVDGERPNPYPCGPELTNDCYDITVLGSTSQGLTSAQMYGTPATVEVANPKTAQASLVSVELGESVKGALIRTAPDWTEIAVTVDGRLLSGRWGGFPRRWDNPETGESKLRNYDLGLLGASGRRCALRCHRLDRLSSDVPRAVRSANGALRPRGVSLSRHRGQADRGR